MHTNVREVGPEQRRMHQAERVLDLIITSFSTQDYYMYMSQIMRVEACQLWGGGEDRKVGHKVLCGEKYGELRGTQCDVQTNLVGKC